MAVFFISIIFPFILIFNNCTDITKVKILHWDKKEQKNKFSAVKLPNLKDLDTAKTYYFQIIASTTITVDENGEEIKGTDEPEMNLHYTTDDDVAIALDFDTLSAFTLLYNFEYTLKWFADNLGVDKKTYKGTLVFYNVIFAISTEGVNSQIQIKMNDAYVPGEKKFLAFKSSGGEDLPLNMNLSVIVHEFGHSIFDNLAPNASMSYSSGVSAINEGLADFFSVLLTGNLDPLGKSLPKFSANRVMPASFHYDNYSETCEGDNYCIGSVLASSLYTIARDDDSIELIDIAKNIFISLPTFDQDYSGEISETKSASESDELINFLNIILTNVAQQNILNYCNSFNKWFPSLWESLTLCAADDATE